MNRIYDEKLKKKSYDVFELLPFFKFWTLKFCNYDIPEMRYCLETSCMDSSWKNSRHIFFVIISPCKITAL